MAPRHDDSLTTHQLPYLNGVDGSGKTTQAIELFWVRDPWYSPQPTASLMRCGIGVSRPIYTTISFRGERMGQKYTRRVIIWDVVPRPILETFLDVL